MVIAYGENGTPVYASRLDENVEARNKQLADMVSLYVSAQRGDADALIYLSDHAFLPSMENKLLREAVNTGSANAQYKFALSLDDEAKKIDILRKAAMQEHAPAQAALGVTLLYARSDLGDSEEARFWLSKAAEKGSDRAKFQLNNLTKLEDFLVRAERGEPDAQFALGKAYASGDAVRMDQTQAVKWWRKAAETGYPPAQLQLATVYLSGDGVPVDLAMANDWAQKAAKHDDPETLLQLAKIYRYGPGSDSKMLEAVKMYERAAALGDRSALYELGTIYNIGEGVQRNNVQAYMWLELAASKYDQTLDFGRSSLAKNMSPAQITEAKRMAREWLAAHPQ